MARQNVLKNHIKGGFILSILCYPTTMKPQKTTYDVIVIGGGPAGMMAAGTAGKNGKSVLLIEKNKRLGEKLRITGGGRCNVTNNEPNLKKLLSFYGSAEPFLYSPFSEFSITDTFSFFDAYQLPLVTETHNRSFPHTFQAADVEQVMETYCSDHSVTILSETKVIDVIIKDSTLTGVTTNKGDFFATSIIIATGGFSHPETGSTGDGFHWLKKLGHTVIPPTPSIVPIKVSDGWIKKNAGTTLPDCKVTFFTENKKQFSKTGNILFTHFGLSGPTILNSATRIQDLLYQGTVTGTLNLFPDKDIKTLDDELLQLFDTHKNKIVKNVLKNFIPAKIVSVLSEFLPEQILDVKVHSLSKPDRRKIIDIFQSLPFTVKGLMGFDRAVVADGGVPLSEINPKTMQSKLHQNVYIIGDLLHINRPSGGFSLQLCWTTGYVAGKNA